MFEAPKSDGTVGKALLVLGLVADFNRPVRFSEILTQSPFPKPTLYRFVQTLTNQGMLQFDVDRQTYTVGARLLRLAHSAWQNSTLAPVARTFLDDLAGQVNAAVHLAQMDNGHVLFVDKRTVTDQFETLASAGRVAPGYCTGVGKAILAFSDTASLDQAMQQQTFVAKTANTLTTEAALRDELEKIIENGVAFDREEHERGIISIAAPIITPRDKVIGAVSIASSTALHSLDDLNDFKPALLQAVEQIGAEAEIWQVPSWT
ncbi:MAG: IclR family transcriptional regulator [Planktomarina sp.]